MKVFISQPMKDKTDAEILKEREFAITKIKEKYGPDDAEIINSLLINDYVSKNRPLYCLGKSLTLLAEADVAYFVKGWEYARGCKIEHTCAIEYGVECIEEEAYHCIDDGLTFGEAIQLMKKGAKIARKGWNGKGQYVELATNVSYKSPNGTVTNVDHKDMGNKALAFVGTSGVQLGWLASQADMLSEDWQTMD